MKEKQMKIMTMLSRIPICSTDLFTHYFKENGSPNKRVSENLQQLLKDKLIEKHPREMGKTCLWRLSKRGRELMCVKGVKPFNIPKIDHILDVGRCCQWLEENGDLLEFVHEPCYPINTEMSYYPDAFFIWERKLYMLEVQRTYLSEDRWLGKWKVAQTFFNDGYFKKASFQPSPTKILKPKIICVSVGNPVFPDDLNIMVMKSIEEMRERITG